MLPAAFRRKSARPAIIGHRGVRRTEVENTLAAITKAGGEGADGVEVDVRATRDGEVVVFHDPDLWRMAGRPERVADVDLADLPWVGGVHAPPEEQHLAPQPIPTFEAVVELCAELGLGLNVELKHDVPAALAFARSLAPKLLAASKRVDLVASSFHPGMLRACRQMAPGLSCALLVHQSAYTAFSLFVARTLRVDGVHLQGSLLEPRRTEMLSRRGFFNVWTVNCPREASRAYALGADAIFTDDPSAMLHAFSHPTSSPQPASTS